MKNTMKYKGYVGSVEFSEKDGVFFGKVMDIRALISYEGTHAQELVDAFHNAVDDYLLLCEAEGIKPEAVHTRNSAELISPGTLRSLTSVYLTCGEQILLLYRQGSRVVNNKWVSSAGGHFEEGEFGDARLCALRELKEELGLDGDALQNLSLRYVSLRRTPEEIRQNYYFFAELPDGPSMKLASNEGVLQWFRLDEMETLDMPFTSKYVTSHWLHTGRFTDALYGGVATGEDMVFTELTEF